MGQAATERNALVDAANIWGGDGGIFGCLERNLGSGGNEGNPAARDSGNPQDQKNEPNPHGFTPAEDAKIIELRISNEFKTWEILGQDVGKDGKLCQERFKQIKPSDWQPLQSGKGAKQAKGNKQGQKNPEKKNGNGGQIRDSKAQGGNDNANSQPAPGGNNAEGSNNDSSGADPAWGDSGWGTSGDVSNDNAASNSWPTGGDANNDNTANNNNGWGNNNDDNKDSRGDTGNTNRESTGNSGNAWNNDSNGNDAWGIKNDNGGGATNSNPGWDSGQNDNKGNDSGNNGQAGDNPLGDSWGGAQAPASKAASKAASKTASEAGSKWPAHSAKHSRKRSSHSHSSYHAHKPGSTTHFTGYRENTRPSEYKLSPDDTFSQHDLRLLARILQQDSAMVWERVSWRFKDKTGRYLPPALFEKKITGTLSKKRT